MNILVHASAHPGQVPKNKRKKHFAFWLTLPNLPSKRMCQFISLSIIYKHLQHMKIFFYLFSHMLDISQVLNIYYYNNSDIFVLICVSLTWDKVENFLIFSLNIFVCFLKSLINMFSPFLYCVFNWLLGNIYGLKFILYNIKYFLLPFWILIFIS